MDSTDTGTNGDEGEPSQGPPQITYDETHGVYRTTVDPDVSDNPSWAIVRAVASITETDPLELEPLGRRIVPEKLDGLFEPMEDQRRKQATVSFPYESHQITVTGAGEITISPGGEPTQDEDDP